MRTTNSAISTTRIRPSTAHVLGGTVFFATLMLGVGCGDSHRDSSGAPPEVEVERTVEEALHELGVDTTETPRVDDQGEPLPETYSPLGPTFALEKLSELTVVGLLPLDSTDPLSMFKLQLPPGEEEPPPPTLLYSLGADAAPWASERTAPGTLPASHRAGIAADVDGDGREEMAYVYAQGSELHLVVIDDQVAEFRLHDSVLIEKYIIDLTLAAGDLDGDGDDELLLGATVGQSAFVVILNRTEAGFAIETTTKKDFPATTASSTMLLDLEVGNLDNDGPKEFAVAANEYAVDTSSGAARSIASTWFVFDDWSANLANLGSGRLEATSNEGNLRTALVADIAVGDLDADGIDEIVVGGVWDPESWCTGRYVVLAMDDAAHGLEPLGSDVIADPVGDEPEGDDGCEVQVRWAHVGVVDLEGDHAAEVHLNELVFWDLRTASPWSLRAEIPSWFTQGQQQDTTQSAMVVADFTGDARQDIAVFAQGRNAVRIWGIPAEHPDQELAVMRSILLEYDTLSEGLNPLLIPVNPDSDTTVLEFVEHRYIFTEPIVLAALAAPPYGEDIGQNVGACNTQFGQKQSEKGSAEAEVKLSVSFIVGSELLDFGNGWDIEAKVTREYGLKVSTSYEKTTSITYTTGTGEDTVVCTVVPYDHYTYRVVSDPYPKRNVGKLVELSIPRKPITLQAERGFFNDAVGSSNVRVDQSVFRHQVGNVRSYPSAAQKDALLDDHIGLEVGPVTVGQGSGSTTLGIAVKTEVGSEIYTGVSGEFEATTTIAAIKIGGSIGVGAGFTLGVAIGNETSYAGTIGSIDAAHFSREHYGVGLFCYWQRDERSGQLFQVINYWQE